MKAEVANSILERYEKQEFHNLWKIILFISNQHKVTTLLVVPKLASHIFALKLLHY
jgi:hypothetical protein